MGKRRSLQIPSQSTAPQLPRGILELDRFSGASLTEWSAVSTALDVLQDDLYFGLEPERRRIRSQLIDALQSVDTVNLHLSRWVRMVSYQYSLMPLSSAGSLQGIGGRFNAGAELDQNTLEPWPALYLAEDYETAFREKFQLASDQQVGGLRPEELALQHGGSHTTLFVNGHLPRVFDMTEPSSLVALAKVLARIKMPARAAGIQKKWRVSSKHLFMVRSGKQLYDIALSHNWRMLPIQFGLPAQTQVLADWIRAAGFEAIRYRSTMGPGFCVAVFPDLIGDDTFIELADASPSEVLHRRLDSETAVVLQGWESISRRRAP